MMRVLALDVGDKRIGIAVSDPLGITAQGLETYNRTGDIEKDAEYIANFAKICSGAAFVRYAAEYGRQLWFSKRKGEGIRGRRA